MFVTCRSGHNSLILSGGELLLTVLLQYFATQGEAEMAVKGSLTWIVRWDGVPMLSTAILVHHPVERYGEMRCVVFTDESNPQGRLEKTGVG